MITTTCRIAWTSRASTRTASSGARAPAQARTGTVTPGRRASAAVDGFLAASSVSRVAAVRRSVTVRAPARTVNDRPLLRTTVPDTVVRRARHAGLGERANAET